MDTLLSLLLDITMAGLLIVTIVYCRKVNARIQVLQDSRSELAQIIREFDASTERATKSIAEIHEATHRLSENMQHKIDKANFLVDDLQTMIEKGNRTVGIVEANVTRGAAASVPPIMPKSVKRGVEAIATNIPTTADAASTPISGSGEGARRVRQRSRAEQEVLDALKNKGE